LPLQMRKDADSVDGAGGWRWRVALALLLAALGLCCLLVAAPGEPLAGGGRIAFVSERDGNWEIYLMDLAGLGVARLTDTPAEEWLPAWSPDGARIAFVSDRDGDWEVYGMLVPEAVDYARAQEGLRPATTLEATNLTCQTGKDWDPAWSPDGSRIAFSSEREGNWEVYVMAAPEPAQFGPGGEEEACARGAGEGQVNLTGHPVNDWLPNWSPDGRRIAFVSDRDGNWEIYRMRADGGGQTNLTRSPGDDWVPAWSPDGRRIAFQSDRDGNWEIYVLELDSGRVVNLTQHPADDWDPSWSPDGRRIAFMSERDGNRELYAMEVDGAGRVVRLTNHPDVDKNAAWAP
jgi:Tol biopolymer transport system component